MLQVAVLISGGGSNLQALIDYSGENQFEICSVISDRYSSGLERAVEAGIDTFSIDRKKGTKYLSGEINEILKGKADLIVLAGFLSILDKSFIGEWRGRIINIHPSLLPDFGGKGMYGLHVHKAVIEKGVMESGCSVHYVDTGIDTGEIIGQMRLIVDSKWDAETLQQEVLRLEHKLLPETVSKIGKNWGKQ